MQGDRTVLSVSKFLSLQPPWGGWEERSRLCAEAGGLSLSGAVPSGSAFQSRRCVARGVLSTHPSCSCALPGSESEHVLCASGAEVPELGVA